MVPEAPALFSTITVVFHMSASFWPITRARMSVPPPGAKPTMMRTGPVGRPVFWASAPGSAIDAATPVTKVLRCMEVSLRFWRGRSGRLLQGDGCRVDSEILHGRGHARAGQLDARKLQAHLAAAQGRHQRQVVAVAQVADAEHAALDLAQARAQGEVEAFVDQLAHRVGVH